MAAGTWLAAGARSARAERHKGCRCLFRHIRCVLLKVSRWFASVVVGCRTYLAIAHRSKELVGGRIRWEMYSTGIMVQVVVQRIVVGVEVQSRKGSRKE